MVNQGLPEDKIRLSKPTGVFVHNIRDRIAPQPDLDLRSQDGRNVLDFKMKPRTPFKTALEAWCDHHGIPQAPWGHLGSHVAARFESHGQ
jgi:hypothetical protein